MPATRYCIFKSCKNNLGTSNSSERMFKYVELYLINSIMINALTSSTFYLFILCKRFPIDEELKKKWCDVVANANGVICKGMGLVCHLHFLPNQIIKKKNTVAMVKGSIPCSINVSDQNSNGISDPCVPVEQTESHHNNNNTQIQMLENKIVMLQEENLHKNIKILKLAEKIEKLESIKEDKSIEITALKKTIKTLEKKVAHTQKEKEDVENYFIDPKSSLSNNVNAQANVNTNKLFSSLYI